MIALTVVRAFGEYQKGASITDPVEVSKILAGHNQRDVVKLSAPDPAPDFAIPTEQEKPVILAVDPPPKKTKPAPTPPQEPESTKAAD